MPRQVLSPPTVHKPTTYYSHAVVVQGVVYLAGQAPHDAAGAVWPMADPAGQVRRVFENMLTVLQAGGATFGDVVRLVILVRRAELLPLVWEVGGAYLGGHQPAMTAAVVEGLADADYLLEMDAIAVPTVSGSPD